MSPTPSKRALPKSLTDTSKRALPKSLTDTTALWLIFGQEQPPDADMLKYQLFFFAGDATALRACWGKMSDRRKKELVRFDRDTQQRDLMEALVQVRLLWHRSNGSNGCMSLK